jgi:hypothetical protein
MSVAAGRELPHTESAIGIVFQSLTVDEGFCHSGHFRGRGDPVVQVHFSDAPKIIITSFTIRKRCADHTVPE